MTHAEWGEKKDKILDKAGFQIFPYEASIEHNKASNLLDNLVLELIGDNEMPNVRMIGVPSAQRDELRDDLRSIITGKGIRQ